MKRQGAWLGLALLAVMVACAPRAPRRPAGLPAASFWVGTRHGGAFVELGAKDRDGWRVRIFDDHSGAVRSEGLFVLRGIARAELGPEDIIACDGTTLRLTDGARLVPKGTP